jgi:hypothetical protein
LIYEDGNVWQREYRNGLCGAATWAAKVFDTTFLSVAANATILLLWAAG